MKLDDAYKIYMKMNELDLIERMKPEKEIDIWSDSCLIAPDWHIPFVNDKMFDYLLRVQKQYKVKDIIVNGDFWDCYKISRFFPQQEISFQDEKAMVNVYLDILCKKFKRIYFTLGNHEWRWIKTMFGYDNMHGLFNSLGNKNTNYIVTNNDHVILNSEWRVCHPQNYSQIPLSVARRLASKYKMNIITGHNHNHARGYDVSGRYICIDAGGLFDKARLDYLQRTSTYSEHKGGFVLIEDVDIMFREEDI